MNSEKSKIKTFKDLLVWQLSHQLAIEIFNLSKISAKTNLNLDLWRQIMRSAFSASANIVEGFYNGLVENCDFQIADECQTDTYFSSIKKK